MQGEVQAGMSQGYNKEHPLPLSVFYVKLRRKTETGRVEANISSFSLLKASTEDRN